MLRPFGSFVEINANKQRGSATLRGGMPVEFIVAAIDNAAREQHPEAL